MRVVCATDAACEGLNLQTLGTLINVDLPWNPSRLEQRIGRIKRYGQQRREVDMANLVYAGTIDEKVYQRLSERMQDRYDILGSLPDTIEDDWIEDIERLEEERTALSADIREVFITEDAGDDAVRQAIPAHGQEHCTFFVNRPKLGGLGEIWPRMLPVL